MSCSYRKGGSLEFAAQSRLARLDKLRSVKNHTIRTFGVFVKVCLIRSTISFPSASVRTFHAHSSGAAHESVVQGDSAGERPGLRHVPERLLAVRDGLRDADSNAAMGCGSYRR